MSINNVRTMLDKRFHVVVIGGGYAGALAANRLQQNRNIDITIINPRPTFVERVRLHQLVARSGEATVDLAGILGNRVRLIVDTAARIDVVTRSVALASGGTVPYDYLIYAVGSIGIVPTKLHGASEFAFPIAELEQAERLRDAVDKLQPDAPICVVGGGLTGIEAASELAEHRREGSVTLLCGGVLGPSLSEKGRASVRRQLKRLGVDVQDDAVVAELRSDHVRLSDGRTLPSKVTVWTAGFGVPDLAAKSGLSTDELGRLLTDETLTSVDNPYIIGAGDAVAPSNEPLRMSCQAAGPLGARAANTVLQRVAGDPLTPLGQNFGGQCISIGRRRGTFQLTHRDDTPRRVYVGGRMAASIKEMICKTVVKQIAKESRKPGSYNWPGSEKQAAAAKNTVA
ncbi:MULTISPECIES: NAD(P)/FAD-dependent oxidoreductase [Mycobacteriaceae]|jgi:NADH dehydrogenase|nr:MULTISPECIES: FAD-dependent oxidoreductase [Mycobacteriaceae]MBE5438484.1 hypothetical protein [Mycobacteroides abscessus]MDM1903806.1 FAD-dependent oxidoreductase [Mycobacteroides abscessus]MDM2351441.1 FAD-dependent oxidoreductase [Mycobacteroides abscessus]MDM2361553.1 FAD-dependent oxidoreductase [Mycobacteroides abscessus]MDM2371665.1 FAD-dependent oxidoreductase [Mycobacteroides abscessus]